MRPATPLTDILERDWDRQLFATGRKPGLATQLGWHSHWTFNSRGSAHGFPDRTLARERIIFAELKRELTGRKSEDANRQPSPAQIEWLDQLAAAGAEVYLWRPSDLEEAARVLSGRYVHEYYGSTSPAALNDGNGAYWTPRSLWIPGVGRADSRNGQLELGGAAA